MASENARATERVHAWVLQHRGVLAQLVGHCVRVAPNMPQRDIAQLVVGASGLGLRPTTPLAKDLFDALPQLIVFSKCVGCVQIVTPARPLT